MRRASKLSISSLDTFFFSCWRGPAKTTTRGLGAPGGGGSITKWRQKHTEKKKILIKKERNWRQKMRQICIPKKESYKLVACTLFWKSFWQDGIFFSFERGIHHCLTTSFLRGGGGGRRNSSVDSADNYLCKSSPSSSSLEEEEVWETSTLACLHKFFLLPDEEGEETQISNFRWEKQKVDVVWKKNFPLALHLMMGPLPSSSSSAGRKCAAVPTYLLAQVVGDLSYLQQMFVVEGFYFSSFIACLLRGR